MDPYSTQFGGGIGFLVAFSQESQILHSSQRQKGRFLIREFLSLANQNLDFFWHIFYLLLLFFELDRKVKNIINLETVSVMKCAMEEY